MKRFLAEFQSWTDLLTELLECSTEATTLRRFSRQQEVFLLSGELVVGFYLAVFGHLKIILGFPRQCKFNIFWSAVETFYHGTQTALWAMRGC